MIYQFEDFELDMDQHELRRSGEPCAIEPQVFKLLELLASNPGRMISKDEINEVVWKGRIVSEAVLSSRISAARTALQDDGKSQRLIKTVHGKGFRFIGEVKPKSDESRKTAHTTNNIRQDSEQSPRDRPSIAVLPFNNMSNDPDQDHFADGLCEDIITALSKISGLMVIARNSSFIYKEQAVDIRQVGREQGVRYVLEGSVRRSGNRVRITAQLIDAQSGNHLWAHRYDRDVDEIFDLQDEITREIVVAMQVNLIDGERARFWKSGTKNFEAWEQTRQANHLINSQTRSKVLEGRKLIEEVLKIDPDYAGAQVVKAQSFYAEVYDGWSEDIGAALGEAKNSLEAALKINNEEPHALILLAMVYLSFRKHDRAYELSQTASKLVTSDALVLNFAAAVSFYCGHNEEAEQICLKAMQSSPMARATILGLLANIYVIMERFGEAATTARTLMAVSSNYIYGPVALAAAEHELGHIDAAKNAGKKALEIDSEFSSSTFLNSKPFRDTRATKRMFSALVAAGLPE